MKLLWSVFALQIIEVIITNEEIVVDISQTVDDSDLGVYTEMVEEELEEHVEDEDGWLNVLNNKEKNKMFDNGRNVTIEDVDNLYDGDIEYEVEEILENIDEDISEFESLKKKIDFLEKVLAKNGDTHGLDKRSIEDVNLQLHEVDEVMKPFEDYLIILKAQIQNPHPTYDKETLMQINALIKTAETFLHSAQEKVALVEEIEQDWELLMKEHSEEEDVATEWIGEHERVMEAVQYERETLEGTLDQIDDTFDPMEVVMQAEQYDNVVDLTEISSDQDLEIMEREKRSEQSLKQTEKSKQYMERDDTEDQSLHILKPGVAPVDDQSKDSSQRASYTAILLCMAALSLLLVGSWFAYLLGIYQGKIRKVGGVSRDKLHNTATYQRSSRSEKLCMELNDGDFMWENVHKRR